MKSKIKRNVVTGIVNIYASFNNVVISVADSQGNVLVWASSGSLGFKGAKKATPYAGQVTATAAAKKALEYGIRTVNATVKGPGVAREAALRAINASNIAIMSINDRTVMPHNGCRRPKRRRV